MSFNNATFTGNLGADAERRVVGDQTVCNFSVAVNQRRKGEEVTLWVRCALWGKRAEAGGVTDYLTKGKQVLVSGPIDLEEYEANGVKRTSIKLMVNEVQLLGGGSEQKKTETKKPAGDPAEKNPFA